MHVTGPGRFTTPAAAAPPASAGMPARGAGSSRPIRTALRRPGEHGLVGTLHTLQGIGDCRLRRYAADDSATSDSELGL